MKRIGINHLRLIKKFSMVGHNSSPSMSECEKFLSKFVSPSTARKIIKDLIDLGLVRIIKNQSDKRIKNLQFEDISTDEFLNSDW